MFVLITSYEGEREFIVKVTENDIGELNVITTYFVEEAISFETEQEAREFKRDYSLRAWIQEV